MNKIRLYIFFGLLLVGSDLMSQQNKELVFISDTQAPIWSERILLEGYRNTEATDSLFNDIIKRKPVSLFILGDLVGIGSDEKLWEDIDDNLALLKEAKITTHAIPGNHEYMFSAKNGIEKYNKRFPESSNFGYVIIQDSVAVIMLNSNFSKLNDRENNLQMELYARSLAILDTAESIKNIIVACHHSPFTNSKVVSSDKDVQDMFVKPYLKSEKATLFISGHSHHLEMFRQKNKRFLVIGGGGGIKQPPYTGRAMKWKDSVEVSLKPLYFYVAIIRNDNELIITVRGFKKDFEFYEFKLD